MPRWHTQGRDPAFIGDGAPVVSFGGIKYFWGNTPALDVLRLKDNEGEAYGKDLHLLFAGKFSKLIYRKNNLRTNYSVG